MLSGFGPFGLVKKGHVMTPQAIEGLIRDGIEAEHVAVEDRTGAGDHFAALVVSESFEGKFPVARHQAVYATLGDKMRQEIHALALTTLTPAEYKARQAARPSLSNLRSV